MKERDQSLDLLRALGLLSIILAHVNPPNLLFQIRTFDVIMMVAVSTISYTEFSKPKPYVQYLWGRVKRLIVPTWKFIIWQSIIFYVLSLATGITSPFPLRTTIIGLLTLSGIGYLWVMRVFLYNALLNPYVKKISGIRGGGIACVIAICVVYNVLELTLYGYFANTVYYAIAEVTILNFIAYGIIAVVAYKLYKIRTRNLLITSFLFAISLTVICFLQGGFVPNTYKYPPGLQYMLWGLFIVAISFLLFRYIKNHKLPIILTFISANSLWIYFWHIIILNLMSTYPYTFTQIGIDNWIKNGLSLLFHV